jgi:hypothetical protein
LTRLNRAPAPPRIPKKKYAPRRKKVLRVSMIIATLGVWSLHLLRHVGVTVTVGRCYRTCHYLLSRRCLVDMY